MSERKESRCPTCYHGYLPLDARARQAQANRERVSPNNGDWLACSDCGGTGTFVLYEHNVVPPVNVFLNGLRSK